jgi:hypothetical protein
MRQKRSRQDFDSVDAYHRWLSEKFDGRLEWEVPLDELHNWSEYCRCVAKRLVIISVRALYRGQKSRIGETDKNNPQLAIRIPRHYVPTRVVLCPRQSAKRGRTAG